MDSSNGLLSRRSGVRVPPDAPEYRGCMNPESTKMDWHKAIESLTSYRVEIDEGQIVGFKLEEDKMKSGNWIVGSIIPADTYNIRGISLSRSPRQHSTKKEAVIEAERLARTEPGKEFVVLKIEGIVVAQNTVWS